MRLTTIRWLSCSDRAASRRTIKSASRTNLAGWAGWRRRDNNGHGGLDAQTVASTMTTTTTIECTSGCTTYLAVLPLRPRAAQKAWWVRSAHNASASRLASKCRTTAAATRSALAPPAASAAVVAAFVIAEVVAAAAGATWGHTHPQRSTAAIVGLWPRVPAARRSADVATVACWLRSGEGVDKDPQAPSCRKVKASARCTAARSSADCFQRCRVRTCQPIDRASKPPSTDHSQTVAR